MGTCTEDNNNSGYVHCTISGEIVAKLLVLCTQSNIYGLHQNVTCFHTSGDTGIGCNSAGVSGTCRSHVGTYHMS